MVKVDDEKSLSEENVARSDEAILFPEVKVGDVTIKPWSFGVLFDIAPSLEEVLDKAEKADLMNKIEGGFLSYTTMARLFTIASSPLLKIMSMTLHMKEEAVRALNMEDGIKIVMVVYNQNKSTISNAIKNVLSPLKK